MFGAAGIATGTHGRAPTTSRHEQPPSKERQRWLALSLNFNLPLFRTILVVIIISGYVCSLATYLEVGFVSIGVEAEEAVS